MTKEVKCKTCGAAIQWVLMEEAKVMPVDLPLKRMIVINGERTLGAVRWVTTSHVETCPDATEHRKRK